MTTLFGDGHGSQGLDPTDPSEFVSRVLKQHWKLILAIHVLLFYSRAVVQEQVNYDDDDDDDDDEHIYNCLSWPVFLSDPTQSDRTGSDPTTRAMIIS